MLVIERSILFVEKPLILLRDGLKKLLPAAPPETFSKPFIDGILPLKEELERKTLSFEIA